jgi:hypothetical protein
MDDMNEINQTPADPVQPETSEAPVQQRTLEDLIQQAKKYPSGSTQRNRYITQMYRLMMRPGRIWGGSRQSQPYYEDVLMKTWAQFVLRLDGYDVTRASVITWFNSLLNYQLLEQERKNQIQSSRTQSTSEDANDPIQQLPAQPDGYLILDKFRRWLKETPKLQTTHFDQRPDITAASVIEYRLLKADYPEWVDLAAYWNVKVRSLQNFWDRRCKPLLETFREYLDDTL